MTVETVTLVSSQMVDARRQAEALRRRMTR
jgi:hypothetical protein